MTLELDHLFCFVPADAPAALEAAGWRLDPGQAHAGQGTANRRLLLAGCYLELLWLRDLGEARSNPLRLDRRADWRTTGASPIGIGLRGPAPDSEDYWLYDALGPRIWIHRDNDDAPERPFVFVFEADGPRHEPGPPLLEATVSAPDPARLPPYDGTAVSQRPGGHHLTVVVAGGGQPLTVGDVLTLRY